eukprot:comp21071_c0_seq3/m.44368 comp21071_c0_seq3/g.44368  ORF comp21071_c0_seq3/g.44368 comp21071_c0_seq3/m.44368 type:complete len:313 (+) comp21071_c0_seq3:346-1284(+)
MCTRCRDTGVNTAELRRFCSACSCFHIITAFEGENKVCMERRRIAREQPKTKSSKKRGRRRSDIDGASIDPQEGEPAATSMTTAEKTKPAAPRARSRSQSKPKSKPSPPASSAESTETVQSSSSTAAAPQRDRSLPLVATGASPFHIILLNPIDHHNTGSDQTGMPMQHSISNSSNNSSSSHINHPIPNTTDPNLVLQLIPTGATSDRITAAAPPAQLARRPQQRKRRNTGKKATGSTVTKVTEQARTPEEIIDEKEAEIDLMERMAAFRETIETRVGQIKDDTALDLQVPQTELTHESLLAQAWASLSHPQ